MWISFSSMVVAFSFIFAKAISDMFMSVVFLFVVHPYDVGDGILIGGDMHFVRPPHGMEVPSGSTEGTGSGQDVTRDWHRWRRFRCRTAC